MRLRTWALVAFAIAGCGSQMGSNQPATPDPVSQTVGSTGGDVTNSAGDGVSIPPGALPGDTNISVTPTPDAPPPPTAMAMGTPITFGPEGQQFLKPVTVTISFDPAKIPAGKSASQLAIFTAPAGTTAYTQLATTVVDATHLAAQVTHFSTFVAGAPTGCAVSCGAFTSGSCTGGGAIDGGAGTPDASCTATMGCGCNAYCNPDGTPAATTPVCDAGVSGGSGTGTGGSCGPAGTGMSYSIECTSAGCVCKVNGTAMAMLAAIDCSADPSSFVAQYSACGFPGVYVPPAPQPDGGVADSGTSGGGGTPDASGGDGVPDSGTGGGGTPDLGGLPDLSLPPGSPGTICVNNTDCLSGVCLGGKLCQ